MATTSFENLLLKSTSISEQELRSLLTMSDQEGVPIENTLAKQSFASAEDALSELCKTLNLNFGSVTYTT